MEDAHKLTCFTGKIERSGGERREGGELERICELSPQAAEWRSGGRRRADELTRWNRVGAAAGDGSRRHRDRRVGERGETRGRMSAARRGAVE